VLLAVAAPATAQQCNAPPGTAAIDEYCESLPTATSHSGGGSGTASTPKPTARTVKQFEQSGTSGKELNRFLGQDIASARDGGAGASDKGSKRSRRGSSADEPAGTAPRQPSSNPLGAVKSAVNSGATVGDGFIWTLIVIALLMSGFAWTRYRRRSSD
jgi:hypothetical protein